MSQGRCGVREAPEGGRRSQVQATRGAVPSCRQPRGRGTGCPLAPSCLGTVPWAWKPQNLEGRADRFQYVQTQNLPKKKPSDVGYGEANPEWKWW